MPGNREVHKEYVYIHKGKYSAVKKKNTKFLSFSKKYGTTQENHIK